jgi:hypothetical protein
MKKLKRSLYVFLFVAAVGGCSASGDSGGRTGGSGPFPGSNGTTGTAGSRSSGNGQFGDGVAGGSGLAPIRPTNTTAPSLSDPNTCASAQVRASRITPTVYLVIDGSSSMNAVFGGMGTRWTVLREALVGQNGVVAKLESVVNFGMTIYSNNDPMKCPAFAEVKPALKNFMPISAGYPAMETGGGTPTGEALQHVVDSLPDFNTVAPDQIVQAPPIIVLATDGEPNGCAAGVICDWVDWANCLGQLLGSLANAPANYDATLKAVRTAKMKGISVWVVSLADGLNTIPDLQRTANIGAGLAEDANPGAMIYSPQNPDELTGTLSKLIGDVVSCDVSLEGSLVVSRACEGTVTMNGTPLDCNNDQGWKAVDEKHIALQGTACAKFKSDPSVVLDARFPCDVVTPQ